MIVALVSHYLTNKLIMRRPFPDRRSFTPWSTCGIRHHFWCLCLSLGYVPTCYSAVRRSCILHSEFDSDSPALELPCFSQYPRWLRINSQTVDLIWSNAKCRTLPLDLHVLG